jgi:hypothetical protein
MMVIAPCGAVADFNSALASSTDTILTSLVSGSAEANNQVSSLSMSSKEHLQAGSSSEGKKTMEYSTSDMDKLFSSLSYSAAQLNNSGNKNRINDAVLQDMLSSRSLPKDDTYGRDLRIAPTDLSGDISSNLRYIYSDKNTREGFGSASQDPVRDISSNLYSLRTEEKSEYINPIASKDLDHGTGSHAYYYYEKASNEALQLSSKEAARNIDSNLNYIYGKTSVTSHKPQKDVYASMSARPSDVKLNRITNDQPINPFLSSLPNLKYICEPSTTKPTAKDISIIKATTDADLGRILQGGFSVYSIPFLANASLIALLQSENMTVLDGKKASLKNYAVVVGINDYKDHRDLHTCVNDADTMAALLESYGFEVVKLTDLTAEKPIKRNILEKALGELKQKDDLGKVLIYFSGHGEKMNNHYYLIPQDGNGQPSSYISTEELEKSIQGLKNVALVVDACNSGELEKVANNGQMVLVSSQEDQPSNEVWFGSLSLFTYNLCKAMREEDKSSNAVVLQRCFYKAREATEKWTNWRLLAQTPQMKDKTVGYFSLK